MNDNDVLFHMDAGCEVLSSEESLQNIDELIEKCNEHQILYTSTHLLEKVWTKMDLFNYMDLNNEEIKNSMQAQATLIIIKKTKMTMEFVEDWYNISCNYNLIDDSPSKTTNDASFDEHRHDQSTFSLMLKTQKYNCFFNKNNIITDDKSIKLSRKRHA